MKISKRIIRCLLISIWFMILCFPILGIKVSRGEYTFMIDRVFHLGIGVFFLSFLWTLYFDRRKNAGANPDSAFVIKVKTLYQKATQPVRDLQDQPRRMYMVLGLLFLCFVILPQVTSMYQTTIFALAFIYVMLALGLNIVVGIAGQLVLGYAAFYAVGAYTYALLNQYWGLGFWISLPIGGFLSVLAGLFIAFPVLRLRGDYLAIVTLGFGEITRLLLTNLSGLTGGAKGVANIPRPSFFGMEFTLDQSTIYMYYIALGAAIITIVVVARIKNSRIGLALQALKEDEIASQAMGIDLRKIKLAAFALGSCWAGFAGVLLAARNSYINPASFTFADSAMILSMVVLGGMGSIGGVVLAALLLSLMPEYLRAFSEYRMLIFGLLMVLMMIFRPQGMIPPGKRKYSPKGSPKDSPTSSASRAPSSPPNDSPSLDSTLSKGATHD